MPETHRAHVRNGRLVLDEPTALPEGSEVELEVVDPASDDDDSGEDDLDEEDRARLHEAIAASIGEFDEGGEGIPAEEVLAELRRRHS